MNRAVAEAFDVDFHRMLGDGVHYRDLVALRGRIEEPEEWCDAWTAAASVHEAIGRNALEKGLEITAGEAFWRASLYCHFGQGHFTERLPDKRAQAEARKVALFRQASSLLRPPLRRVEIPFDGELMPAYLRRPAGASRAPCVILFGGLGSTKEDSLSLGNLIVDRGMATLAFDGPGQGEMYGRMKLISDFERSASAAIDYLAGLGEIDGGRIGIVGRSTGGHWACKAAARDGRIGAAIAWGLIYHLRDFAAIPAGLVDLFVHAAGLAANEDARRFLRDYDLAGVGSRIEAPLMIVQGGQDKVATLDGARQLMGEVGGSVELLSFPDSGHCCHDRSYLVKPAMADFLAKQLGASAMRPK
jgi:2,6-dihydroxypseudooxynicotine hydrolase